MIDLEKAKAICEKEYSAFPIAQITDIGDMWAFEFDSGEPPIITVKKENGEVGELTIPPIENLDILEKGEALSYKWYKENETDIIWWLDNGDDVKGAWIFSFDKKKEYNMFRDYPHALTAEEKEIFDSENPYWKEFFSDRQ